LAGSLKRELKSKYGITPKVKHQYHELKVLVDGRSVYRYSTAHTIPTLKGILQAIGLEP